MQITLANPRGFCAGVDRAIEIVERAIEAFGAPIYVRHEVVHNRFVVDNLREKGAVFVNEIDEVPDGATVIFSAHGVSYAVEQEAARRDLHVFDATCPLVTKVHMEVARYAREGREVVMIGLAGLPEVEGTLGRYDTRNGGKIMLVESPDDVATLDVDDPKKLAFVSQTTLSVDDTQMIIETLRERFPSIKTPRKEDICYATQNRQDAVKALADKVDLLLVVGAANSSNSNRLRELGERGGIESYLINNADEIQSSWLEGKTHIGVTAGASAPEILVEQVVQLLSSKGHSVVEEALGATETISFSIPKALRNPLPQKA
ncbi:MAG: 4-hydroxy-3-methylbut-2-enyl diphosphate reductase [Pseudomonadota bacterium]